MATRTLNQVFANIAGTVRIANDRFLGLPLRSATLPTPSIDYRGALAVVPGGAGVADTFQICGKTAAGAYAWGGLGGALTMVESTGGAIAAGATGDQTATCPAGQVATGGGCQMSGVSSTQFEGRIGSTTNPNDSFVCRMRNDTGANQTITAQVVCQTSGIGGGSGGGSEATTVADTSSIDLTLTGTQITATAIFGATAGTVAQGDHTHAAAGVGLETVLLLGGM